MSPRDPGPTRAAILMAASDLLEGGGPDAVTLRAVGETAGVSRSAAYRHFDDKSALLSELARQTLDGMAAAIRAAAIDSDSRVNLRLGSGAYVEYVLNFPHHYQLIFGDTPISAPAPELEAAADSAMLALQTLVERAQAAGQLGGGAPRELATVLWVLLHGIAALQITGHLHEPRTLDGDTRLGELLDLALASFSPAD
ncbi:TetR/AcrR family transcriptional regulator [Leucobacter coleopterorum]|uniref:TetR/AcrR family transcriptional regulator n=1 Tax=Leucobacter coleopterorum TaxID=2714933 RepID=A0ABX6JXB3_9MICO|nr:TetR/AcrR family transcriptional regulator [Leucobacter coleopterorum]QIM18966.1 TetR/AcrR family transcriptional regulator [Leucobacter coleopterorum]